MFQNLNHLFKKKNIKTLYILLVMLAFGVWWYFTDIRIMLGNYGKVHTYTDIWLSIVMIFWFPLFLIALYYKGMLFWKAETLEKKNILGTVGGTIGTILSGCSCCGLTLASYFGLLPLMNLLPYDGLEIKILWTLGLLYALFDIIKNLETCKVKSK